MVYRLGRGGEFFVPGSSWFTLSRAGRIQSLTMKTFVKGVVPPYLLAAYRRMRLESARRANAKRTAADVFSEVYRNRMWGEGEGPFYSGPGSDLENSNAYCELVRTSILSLGLAQPTVVDLGCGDFRVAKRILTPGMRYV